MEKINIRKFSRGVYTYIKDLPILVYNKKTGKVMFLVVPAEEVENYEI